jgi:hypothetical protein
MDQAARSKRSAFITFVQAATKSLQELLAAVALGVDFGNRAQLGVRPEDQIHAGRRPFRRAGGAVSALEHVGMLRRGFQTVPMSSRLTKKSFVSAPGRGEARRAAVPPWLAPSARRPPISTVISGAVSVSSCALSISSSSGET